MFSSLKLQEMWTSKSSRNTLDEDRNRDLETLKLSVPRNEAHLPYLSYTIIHHIIALPSIVILKQSASSTTGSMDQHGKQLLPFCFTLCNRSEERPIAYPSMTHVSCEPHCPIL